MPECEHCGADTWVRKAGHDPETGYVLFVCPDCYSDEVTPRSQVPRHLRGPGAT